LLQVYLFLNLLGAWGCANGLGIEGNSIAGAELVYTRGVVEMPRDSKALDKVKHVAKEQKQLITAPEGLYGIANII